MLSHLVLILLRHFKLKPLIDVCSMIPLFLLSNHPAHLVQLVSQFFDLLLHFVKFIINLLHFLMVMFQLGKMLVEGLSEEEFAVADATHAAHPARFLYLAQGQVRNPLDPLFLLGKDSELVRTFLTGSMPAELASIFVILLKLGVAYEALVLVDWIKSTGAL